MKQITYVDAWSVDEQKPGRVYTLDEARARHAAGEAYTVLIGAADAPEKVVTLALDMGMVTVQFLDKHKRIGMTSVYAQRERDRMFNEWTAFYSYADDDLRGACAIHWETTDYRKDGAWQTTVHSRDGEERTTGTLVNVEENWEDVPSFGDYTSISRYDDRDA